MNKRRKKITTRQKYRVNKRARELLKKENRIIKLDKEIEVLQKHVDINHWDSPVIRYLECLKEIRINLK